MTTISQHKLYRRKFDRTSRRCRWTYRREDRWTQGRQPLQCTARATRP